MYMVIEQDMHTNYNFQVWKVGEVIFQSVRTSWERGRSKNAMDTIRYVNSLKFYPCNLLKLSGIQHKEEWRPLNSWAKDWWQNDTCVCLRK